MSDLLWNVSSNFVLIFCIFFDKHLSGNLQSELSVQFDDLFKKAWQEDVTEFVGDGLYYLETSFNFLCFLCLKSDFIVKDL